MLSHDVGQCPGRRQHGIADFYFDCARLVGIVHEHEQAFRPYFFSVEVTHINKRAVIAEDMHILAPPQCRMLLAQMEQAADMSKNLLFIRSSASRGECIARVAWEPAGKITAV